MYDDRLDDIAYYELGDYHGDNAVVSFFSSDHQVLLQLPATSRKAREWVSVLDNKLLPKER